MIRKLYWDDKKSIKLIQRAISRGKVVVGSSDTVFGLLAPLSKKGLTLLNTMKRRKNKPYLVLVGSVKRLEAWVDHGQLAHVKKLIENCWPGPLTLILRAKDGLPAFLRSSQGTIAIRIPDHAGLRALLERVDGLFSTSANQAGHVVPESIGDIDPLIIEQSAYIVTDRCTSKKIIPSTILDVTAGKVRVIRPGAYALKELEKIYGQPFIYS